MDRGSVTYKFQAHTHEKTQAERKEEVSCPGFMYF